MALIYSSFFARFFSVEFDSRQHAKDRGFFFRFLESMVRKTDSDKRSQYFGRDPFGK